MADHSHSHADVHAHGHAHPPRDFGRAFAIGIGLNLAFLAIETVYGFLANSMALLADAGHNLSDVLGLVVAWAAAVMARRAASPRFTYGLKKAPILAALANSLFLLVAIGAIGAEAVRRLFHPSPTDGGHGDGRRSRRNRDQCRDSADVRARARARHQHRRRLLAHGRGRRGFGGGCVCRAGHRVDRPAMGRSGDEPRGRGRHPVEQHRPVQRIGVDVARGGSERDRRRSRRGRARAARRRRNGA